MWIVFNGETGYSDESMRFADRHKAVECISKQDNPDAYNMRYEFE